MSIVCKTDLLEHPIKLPFDFALGRGADPSRSVLGAGRDAESTSSAERPFNADEMTRAIDALWAIAQSPRVGRLLEVAS